MKVDNATLEGLQMIRERYYFGMFTGDGSGFCKDENAEYKMRDALYTILNRLELTTPSLFDDEFRELEGGSRGGTIPAGSLPEIDIEKE